MGCESNSLSLREFLIVDRGHVFFSDRSIHGTRDNLLRTQTIQMRYRERLPSAAALQEDPELFLISRTITIDELRKRLIIPPHFKFLESDRLFRLSRPVCLNSDLEKFLIEASNANQTPLAVDHCLAAITGNMITSHLNLADQFIAKIQQHQRIVEIFVACSKSMTEDARADRHRQLGLAA